MLDHSRCTRAHVLLHNLRDFLLPLGTPKKDRILPFPLANTPGFAWSVRLVTGLANDPLSRSSRNNEITRKGDGGYITLDLVS